jgi:FixJ family two-component response regulator
VQEKCEDENIQLLSKDLIDDIVISQQQTIVLIDDDELIREGWKLLAIKKNIALITYANADDFVDCDLRTPIYIDVELASNKNGIEVARSLSQKGYQKLYLCTGHVDIKLSDYPFLSGIVNKNFPTFI